MEHLHLDLHLQDTEWQDIGFTHERPIARAIVVDDEGFFYFMRVSRDDIFGCVTVMETVGGGVEIGETISEAILREVKEELGAEVELLCQIGLVKDEYRLIQRKNLNHYFLCRVTSFGKTSRTQAEVEDFHLQTMRVSFEAAVRHYETQRDTSLGRLITARELPVLQIANEYLNRKTRNWI